MSHYQERINSLTESMRKSDFEVTNPSEESLGVRSKKKNVRFKADVFYEQTPLSGF